MKYLLYTRNLDTWNLAATTKAHRIAGAEAQRDDELYGDLGGHLFRPLPLFTDSL
jgi:hypothetical protein